MMDNLSNEPAEILIVGAGVFGLSAAFALVHRQRYSKAIITILDSAQQLPNHQGASVDSSRILRADYALHSYTKLVAEAKKHWKDTSKAGWGGEGRYHEARLLLTAEPGSDGHVDGYLEASLTNIRHLAKFGTHDIDIMNLKELHDKAEIQQETPNLQVSGDYGYINGDCGWVDAEACTKYMLDKILREGRDRIKIIPGAKVQRLLYENLGVSDRHSRRCRGVQLDDMSELYADLVILAAGAWTPSLVDLQGRAMATGQVLAYLSISEEEQERYQNMPIYFNVSRGMFLVPPHNREIKVGRHGFGYQNPRNVSLSRAGCIYENAVVSVPRTGVPIPSEAEVTCKEFLVELFPKWRDREFDRTRVCWYCDTPTGDFLIDYHPDVPGLFIAAGDSGHGFKVFPVIGEKIVDAIQGTLEQELHDLWCWRSKPSPDFVGTEDGTRGGRRGMMLDPEYPRHLRTRA